MNSLRTSPLVKRGLTALSLLGLTALLALAPARPAHAGYWTHTGDTFNNDTTLHSTFANWTSSYFGTPPYGHSTDYFYDEDYSTSQSATATSFSFGGSGWGREAGEQFPGDYPSFDTGCPGPTCYSSLSVTRHYQWHPEFTGDTPGHTDGQTHYQMQIQVSGLTETTIITNNWGANFSHTTYPGLTVLGEFTDAVGCTVTDPVAQSNLYTLAGTADSGNDDYDSTWSAAGTAVVAGSSFQADSNGDYYMDISEYAHAGASDSSIDLQGIINVSISASASLGSVSPTVASVPN